MREKFKEIKMKWPLIPDGCGSSQQTISKRFVSTWPHIWSKSVEIFFNCHNASRPSHMYHPSRPRRPILFLLISAIVLAIATIINAVFELKSRDFGCFNEINSEYELEKSGLTNDPLWPQTQTQTQAIDTAFDFNSTGAGLREFNDLNNEINNVIECEFGENFNDNNNDNGQQHTTAPAFNFGSTSVELVILFFYVFYFCFFVYHIQHHTQHHLHNIQHINYHQLMLGLCEFDNIKCTVCIFDSNISRIGLQYDISFGMLLLFFPLF